MTETGAGKQSCSASVLRTDNKDRRSKGMNDFICDIMSRISRMETDTHRAALKLSSGVPKSLFSKHQR